MLGQVGSLQEDLNKILCILCLAEWNHTEGRGEEASLHEWSVGLGEVYFIWKQCHNNLACWNTQLIWKLHLEFFSIWITYIQVILLLYEALAHEARKRIRLSAKPCCLAVWEKITHALQVKSSHLIFCSFQLKTTRIYKKNGEVAWSWWENGEGFQGPGTGLCDYKIAPGMVESWSLGVTTKLEEKLIKKIQESCGKNPTNPSVESQHRSYFSNKDFWMHKRNLETKSL